MDDVNSILNSAEGDFGYALRSAREAKGYTIISVAEQLHLDEQIVLALESHQLASLPESAYVCGYIRNYARLLEISPEPLIEQFKQEADLKSHLTSVNSIGNSIEKKQQISSFVFILFLCVFFLISLIYAWKTWQEPEKQEEAVSISLAEENISSDKTEGADLFLPDKKNVQSDDINLEVNESMFQPQSEDKTLNDNKLVSEENIKLIPIEATVTSEIENNVGNITQQNQLEQITEVVEETQNDEVIEQSNIQQNSNSNDERRLNLTFTKDSWISVKDARKKSLVYDLMRKGEQLSLKGKAPISVFLGDATGVVLTVDDEPYSLATHINNKNVAKFTVK